MDLKGNINKRTVGKLDKQLTRRVKHFSTLLKLTEKQKKTLAEWYLLQDKYFPWVIIAPFGLMMTLIFCGLIFPSHSDSIDITLEYMTRVLGGTSVLMIGLYVIGYSGWKILKNWERTIRWKERRGIYD